jgi:hypothetical protein
MGMGVTFIVKVAFWLTLGDWSFIDERELIPGVHFEVCKFVLVTVKMWA